MIALIILTFYLLWTTEVIRTKTLSKSLILPIITSLTAIIIHVISPESALIYLIIISITCGLVIYKKANSIEDVEILIK